MHRILLLGLLLGCGISMGVGPLLLLGSDVRDRFKSEAEASSAARIKRPHTELTGEVPPSADAALVPKTAQERRLAEVRLRQDIRAIEVAVLAGNFNSAQAQIQNILVDLPPGSSYRERAEKLLETVLAAQRQIARLDEIERLLEEYRYEDASKALGELVGNVNNVRVLERLKRLWEQSHPAWKRGRPNWWRPVVVRMAEWALGSLPYLAAIAILVLCRKLWRAWGRRQSVWRLAGITDSTKLQVGGLFLSYLLYWARQGQEQAALSTGLLLLEATRIPAFPGMEIPRESNLLEELEHVPLSLSGLDVGHTAKLLSALKRWFTPGRREIRAVACPQDGQGLVVHLTARYYDREQRKYGVKWLPRKFVDRAVTTTASCEKSDAATAKSVVEEVTFKMLYTITHNGDVLQGERANDLRKGLEKLRAYISGAPPKEGGTPWASLEESYRTFAEVRTNCPDSLEAHLYEGIALDLLERHEEAIAHFKHVKERATEPAAADETQKKPREEMRQRAAYNEAIAHLRNLYQLEGINRCIELIDELMGRTPDLNASPIMALALAVKADAIANKPVAWRDIPDDQVFAEADQERTPKAKLTILIKKWIGEVNAITQTLERTLNEARKKNQPDWDQDALRQLDWAIHNAEGDLYLYSGIALYEQVAREIREERRMKYLDAYGVYLLAEHFLTKEERGRLSTYLDKALSALRKCEMLLPAGVETLSNLGTLFLFRDPPEDLEQARDYLERVIDLNPRYEYGYLRLAQCWEKERWREKVIDVLKKFPSRPKITSLKTMYQEYGVQPFL